VRDAEGPFARNGIETRAHGRQRVDCTRKTGQREMCKGKTGERTVLANRHQEEARRIFHDYTRITQQAAGCGCSWVLVGATWREQFHRMMRSSDFDNLTSLLNRLRAPYKFSS
jgi:hypothetical protein